MSRARGRGAVDYNYDPSSLIQCLLLKSKLKPSVTLQDCLSSVAPLLFGKIPAGVLANALREGSMRLPQDSVLRDAQIRLDLLSIAYERFRLRDFVTWRYPAIDASSAYGQMWFMAREDLFEFKRTGDPLCGVAPGHTDLNACLKTRTLMLSTLGRGRGSLVKKSFNYLNLHRMESADEESFAARREQVFGIVADQGTEKGIADIDLMAGHEIEDAKILEKTQRAFPHALWMPEHLHIFNNALENAINKLDVWESFLPRLRAVERFLQDQSLRMLFIATCLIGLPEIARQFMSYSSLRVEWRWEYLEKSLDKLIPLLPHLIAYMHVDTMLKSAEGTIKPASLH